MKSKTTKQFRRLIAALPAHARVQAKEAYRLFAQNPAHPGLQFKKLNTNPATYSARVGIGYRAVGAISGNAIVWFWIGSHADYDALLDQM